MEGFSFKKNKPAERIPDQANGKKGSDEKKSDLTRAQMYERLLEKRKQSNFSYEKAMAFKRRREAESNQTSFQEEVGNSEVRKIPVITEDGDVTDAASVTDETASQNKIKIIEKPDADTDAAKDIGKVEKEGGAEGVHAEQVETSTAEEVVANSEKDISTRVQETIAQSARLRSLVESVLEKTELTRKEAMRNQHFPKYNAVVSGLGKLSSMSKILEESQANGDEVSKEELAAFVAVRDRLANTIQEFRSSDVYKEAITKAPSDVESGDEKETPATAVEEVDTPKEEQQWEKRVVLKNDWESARNEYTALIGNRNAAQRLFGLQPKGAKEAQQKMLTARNAYVGKLGAALKARAERQQELLEKNEQSNRQFGSGEELQAALGEEETQRELYESAYKPYFVQRFVIGDVQEQLAAQKELLTDEQKVLVDKTRGFLQKHKTARIVGSVSLSGAIAASGAVGVAAAAVVGGGAAALKLARIIGGSWAGAKVGEKVWQQREGSVRAREKEAYTAEQSFKSTDASSPYKDYVSELDDMVAVYEKAHKNVKKAKRNQKISSAAAGIAVGGGGFLVLDGLLGDFLQNDLPKPVETAADTPEPKEVMKNEAVIGAQPERQVEVTQEPESETTASVPRFVPEKMSTPDMSAHDVPAYEGVSQTNVAEVSGEQSVQLQSESPMTYFNPEDAPVVEKAVNTPSAEEKVFANSKAQSLPEMPQAHEAVPQPATESTPAFEVYTIAQGDTLTKLLQGRGGFPQPVVFTEMPTAGNKQALMELLADKVRSDATLRQEIGFNNTPDDRGWLSVGDVLTPEQIAALDTAAREIAVENDLFNKQSVNDILAQYDEQARPNQTEAERKVDAVLAKFDEEVLSKRPDAVQAYREAAPIEPKERTTVTESTPKPQPIENTPNTQSIENAPENSSGSRAFEQLMKTENGRYVYETKLPLGSDVSTEMLSKFRAGAFEDIMPPNMSGPGFLSRLYDFAKFAEDNPEILNEMGIDAKSFTEMDPNDAFDAGLLLQYISDADMKLSDVRNFL